MKGSRIVLTVSVILGSIVGGFALLVFLMEKSDLDKVNAWTADWWVKNGRSEANAMYHRRFNSMELDDYEAIVQDDLEHFMLYLYIASQLNDLTTWMPWLRSCAWMKTVHDNATLEVALHGRTIKGYGINVDRLQEEFNKAAFPKSTAA